MQQWLKSMTGAESGLQELWAITSYFNPVGYRTRLDNYHIFRRYLNIPLLTVELSFHGSFELTRNDADILVQIHEGDVMWQKERLLNIALHKLPDQCKYIMWLDCDIVFEREDWLASTVEALHNSVLIQPYSIVYDVQQGTDVSDTLPGNVLMQRESMAWKICHGTIDFDSTSTSMLGHYSPGHAWAVQRAAVEQSGFYDAMILGSGDFAMAMAAVEHHDDIVRSYGMNASQAKHYLTWAKKWRQAIHGSIGVVAGGLRHLWHGHMEDRGYGRRYASFTQFAFDPYTDIKVGANGGWCWSSDKPELHAYCRKYFESRKEDGHQGAVPTH
jgi:hypothetical protein